MFYVIAERLQIISLSYFKGSESAFEMFNYIMQIYKRYLSIYSTNRG